MRAALEGAADAAERIELDSDNLPQLGPLRLALNINSSTIKDTENFKNVRHATE